MTYLDRPMWLVITPSGKVYRRDTWGEALRQAEQVARVGVTYGFYPYKCTVRKWKATR